MSSSRASLRSALVLERSQPASHLVRSGVDRTKGRRRSGDRYEFERSHPASQLARFGVNSTRGSRRSGDRYDNAATSQKRKTPFDHF
jgi:hypothetical protein